MAAEEEHLESITARLVLSYLCEAGMWSAAECFGTKSPYTVNEVRQLQDGGMPYNPLLKPLQTIVKEHYTMHHQMFKLLNMFGKITSFKPSDSTIYKMDMLIEFLKSVKDEPNLSKYIIGANSNKTEKNANPQIDNFSAQTMENMIPLSAQPERPQFPDILPEVEMDPLPLYPQTPRFLVVPREDRKTPEHDENMFYPSVSNQRPTSATPTTGNIIFMPKRPKLREV